MISNVKRECLYSGNGCDLKLIIIVDWFHVEECYEKNRESGYPVYQNIAVANHNGGNTDQIIKKLYAEQIAILYELGEYVNSKTLDSW